MLEQKPPSAPPCWGRQFDDNDKECANQCEYRLTCKPAFFRSHSTPGGMSLPMYQPQPATFWQGSAPLPAPILPFQGFPQPQQQQAQPARLGVAQPPPIPATFQALQNPMALMQQHHQVLPPPPLQMQTAQPGHIVQQTAHSPYFMQYYSPYPGETVLQRLGKHMMLRLGQVLFHELSNFLGLWKWPPNK